MEEHGDILYRELSIKSSHLEAENARLREALEFGLGPIKNYCDGIARIIEFRKSLDDLPFPEYLLTQLDTAKRAIALIEAVLAKKKELL